MKKLRAKVDDQTWYIMQSLRGNHRSWNAAFSTLRYVVETRRLNERIITKTMDHMAIDLPEELQPIPSCLRVIGLELLNRCEEERSVLIEDLVSYMQKWKPKTHTANLGDIQVAVPGEKVEK